MKTLATIAIALAASLTQLNAASAQMNGPQNSGGFQIDYGDEGNTGNEAGFGDESGFPQQPTGFPQRSGDNRQQHRAEQRDRVRQQQQPGGFQQTGGFPQQPQGPQHAPDSAYTGVQGVSPQVAALFTNTAYREIEGEIMAVASYAPDGGCQVTIGGRTGGQSFTTQTCRYGVRELGNGRIALAAKVMINGKTMTDVMTLRIGQNGSLIDEKTRTVSTRIR